MARLTISRRNFLKASAAFIYAAPARAAAPPPQAITLALIAAAKQESLVVWYTSADLQLAELVGKAFQQKFGIAARVERGGAERIFTRVAQEYGSGIHAVDAVNTGDAAQFLAWKRQDMLAPYVPDDVAKHIPPDHRDPDGLYATVRSSLCVIAYNTELVKRDEAPKSFADLLDPKWKGKIVKAHPSYSGTIMTSTYQTVRELGWPYLEKLSKQDVLQVQSATDTPKKIVLGERAVMADGNEYNVLLLKEAGKPIEPVYASEGSPFIV
jgi:iron(III) transport system substrate-binding protein